MYTPHVRATLIKLPRPFGGTLEAHLLFHTKMGCFCVAAHHKPSLERCVMKSLEWHTIHIYIHMHPAARVCQFWCLFWLKYFFLLSVSSVLVSSLRGSHCLGRNTPQTHSYALTPVYWRWAASAMNATIIYETKALVTPRLVSEAVSWRCLLGSSHMNTLWCHTGCSHCLAPFSGCHTV